MARYFSKLEGKSAISFLKLRVEGERCRYIRKNKQSSFSRYDYKKLTPAVEKDLSKVEFDCENLEDNPYGLWSLSRDVPVGYHLLDNGLAILGITAGEDGHIPIFFCLYLDHNMELRGYIPKKGNTWYGKTWDGKTKASEPYFDGDMLVADIEDRMRETV